MRGIGDSASLRAVHTRVVGIQRDRDERAVLPYYTIVADVKFYKWSSTYSYEADQTWTDDELCDELDKGGHFAAFEQPDLFIEELRSCFGKM